MKYLFIVNPIAGGSDHTEQIRVMAEASFRNRPEDTYEIYVTKTSMDAANELARRAESENDLFYVLACGGDGTFNECCNGAAYHDNVAVAPFPVGTGNDFCRMFGDDSELYRNLNAILDGSKHKIDLASVNGRYCAGIASVGFDARVGINVHKYSGLPFCKGAGAYVASLIVEAFKGLSRNVEITCGDYYYHGPLTLCAVCNGRYYGGGFNPIRDAMPDDGILDILIANKVNLPTFARYVGQYKSGQAETLHKYFTRLKGDNITIKFEEESVINCDGEGLYGTEVHISLHRNCMNLIVPKGMSFFT